ncbi:MAG: SHOCT domain-containing protein [Nitrospirota bacterium]
MGYGGWGGYGYGMGGYWGILSIVFWIALIVGVIFLVRWVMVSTRSPGVRREDAALELLKKRYARGEIDKEEFEQKRKDLES